MSEAVIGKISGSYYAKGRSVWRSPEKTPNGFKMGFRVCDLSDGVEDDGAQEIADALNAHDLEDQRDALQAENARLRDVLEWYGEQARLCRLIHSEGDTGRNALANDGGKKASAALEAKE
jgi:hypothetical protein